MLSIAKLLISGNISKIEAPEKIIHLSTIKLDVINIWNIIILMFKIISITVIKVWCPNVWKSEGEGIKILQQKQKVQLCSPLVKRPGDHCSCQLVGNNGPADIRWKKV